MIARRAGAAFAVALAACQPEATPQPSPGNDITAAPAAETNLPVAPQAEPPAIQETSEPAPDLPLDKGVYILADSDCRNPANAAFRRWDGKGLSGSATRDCVASPVVQRGVEWTVEQTCTDTYSGKRSSATLKLRIPDRQHVTILGGAMAQGFRLCPVNEVPDWLRGAP